MKNIKRPNYLKLTSIIPLVALLIFVFSCENDMSASVDKNLMQVGEASNNDGENIDAESKNLPLNIIKEDTIYNIVENQPQPVGGIEEFYKTIATNIKYPADAKEQGIEGKVYVEFVVMKDGSVSNVKVIRGISESCDLEAERVIKESTTKWIPGEHRGTKLNVKLVMPISFKLD